jgi:hypothetical protein
MIANISPAVSSSMETVNTLWILQSDEKKNTGEGDKGKKGAGLPQMMRVGNL